METDYWTTKHVSALKKKKWTEGCHTFQIEVTEDAIPFKKLNILHLMVWQRSVGEDLKNKHVWPASVIRFDLTLEKKRKKKSIRIHIKEESSQRWVSSQPGICEGFKVQLVFGI